MKLGKVGGSFPLVGRRGLKVELLFSETKHCLLCLFENGKVWGPREIGSTLTKVFETKSDETKLTEPNVS